MALLKTAPLEERIKSIRAEIDAFIDALVEKERERGDFSVPAPMVRHCITQGIGCQCAAYLEIKARDDEAATGKTA
jgi:hypothetical protein